MLKELEADNLIYDQKNKRLGTVVKITDVGADVWWHDRPKGKLERINNFDNVVKRNDMPEPIDPKPFQNPPKPAASTPTRSKMIKASNNSSATRRIAASGAVLQDIKEYCEEVVKSTDLNNKPSLERIRDALNILERIQRG